MKTFHPSSFVYGLISGAIILFLFGGVMRLLSPEGPVGPRNRTDQQQGRRIGMGQNMKGIAEQLGMTEDELRTELKSGKNLRDLAEERGIPFPLTRQKRPGSGSTLSTTGSSLPLPVRP
ncbi:MAG: hypothetical protein PHO20_03460 [Candidatus Peribacteraceae bacterium]|nr:hypothetical protein [Candidatus Peribacteraceae bacterium]MDD5739800.1 hypothetical protein [Candidatus Peribacteraceae bacterium]